MIPLDGASAVATVFRTGAPARVHAVFATIGALCAQALERARFVLIHMPAPKCSDSATPSSRRCSAVSRTNFEAHSPRSRMPPRRSTTWAMRMNGASLSASCEPRPADWIVWSSTCSICHGSKAVSSSPGSTGARRPNWWLGALEAVSAVTAATAVEVDMPDDLPFVRADPVLTGRILLNLLHNAVRHGAPPIRIEVRVASASIDLAVVDAGPGVASTIRESIFEPFFGAAERGGLGLGLSRGLAEAQAGHLRLEPTDIGARFVLSLPVDDWADR